MTQTEFEKLCADARAFGDALGVVAILRMVNTRDPGGPRIMLRVFRIEIDEPPREHSRARGYHPETDDLREQIRADIRIAAGKLAEAAPAARARAPKDQSK